MSDAAGGRSQGTWREAMDRPNGASVQTGTPVPSRRRYWSRRKQGPSPGWPPGSQSLASRRYVCFLLTPSKKSRWSWSAEAWSAEA